MKATFWAVLFLICLPSIKIDHNEQKTIELANGVTFKIDQENISVDTFQKKPSSYIFNDISFFGNEPGFGFCCEDAPQTKVKYAYITINDKQINLDVSLMYNPNFPTLNQNSFKVIKKNDIYIIVGRFSDGMGAYVTQWIIIGNKSYRTIISNKENIFKDLFSISD